MSRITYVIALALAAAAATASIAQAVVDPSGRQVADPLAASYLRQQGLSPGEIKVRTQGVDPLAASYLRNHGFPQAQIQTEVTTTVPVAAKPIDPLAQSYLRQQGLSPGEVKVRTEGVDPLAASYLRGMGLSPAQIADWTAGVCSGETKPAVCLSAFEPTAPPATQIATPGGFDWSDAGIGAAATLGLVLLLAGLGAAFVIARHNRGRPVASA
jgi:hypothetical protein